MALLSWSVAVAAQASWAELKKHTAVNASASEEQTVIPLRRLRHLWGLTTQPMPEVEVDVIMPKVPETSRTTSTNADFRAISPQ